MTDGHWLLEEQTAITDGARIVAGIDEAGRGALAGPVVAACVVLPRDYVPAGVNDSKQLTAKQREACFAEIQTNAVNIGIGIVSSKTIDSINILRASHEAMRIALANIPSSCSPDFVLIDGLPVHPFPIPQRAIVKGDAKSASIAAASIIAKVTRDHLMVALHELYPAYGFADHKGYGTQAHLKALNSFGAIDCHRQSYKPVAIALGMSVPQTGTRQGTLDLEL